VAAAQNPSRSVKLWFPAVDRKSRGAVGGYLRMSWRKGEHRSRMVMAVVVLPLLKSTEEDRGGGVQRTVHGRRGPSRSGAWRSGGAGAR
jgi:hypothetical protein